MTPDLLAAIVAAARTAARERERRMGAALGREAATRRPRRDAFIAALREPGVRVIAECKRRSPSAGVLRALYDPVAIARGYATAGAAAISVLTEPTFFDGSVDHLRDIRAVLPTPLLRKDFLVTEFQLLEARAAGADAALLIVAALDDTALGRLLSESAALELAALVEVHDQSELCRALAAGATLIGVNSRDLRTLQVSPDVFDALVPALPATATVVAESGLRSPADATRLRALGYHAFLIGERFMAEPDPAASLAAFLAASGATVRQ